MAFIVIDKDNKEQMRSDMREEMRRGYRSYPHMRNDDSNSYREGYKHGWEDAEEEEHYRRSRDSRGRYI